ncbi:hypothetical protein ACSBQY_01085 [Micrococcus lylae]|uniref:Uncharacterized protein n=1 Tax=Micrococcus lylae TaxID=1273 RepID=A0ABY2K206_9MICC|nr:MULTISPECIES: hypothetical protein [Micrococcus]MCT2006785.1 hypothetical protein [Micrococcus lylae]MCT2070681.1 hypothetical protein [Micrococcus lylae]OFR90808.1 hypothetical protein HMPREF2863_06200 [Micrococcus sp. HMSC067E09]TFI01199.1 hypothetical protein E4A49_01730 [Micrococcus lylae]WIK82367.1 hypothetical protein CJ228_000610 [Micrococcus lylae]
MIRNGKPIDHSNVGGLWGSLVAFIVSFGLFVGVCYAIGFWTLENVWVPGIAVLVCAVLAFLIPKQILGRGDSVDEVAIHTPASHAVERGH